MLDKNDDSTFDDNDEPLHVIRQGDLTVDDWMLIHPTQEDGYVVPRPRGPSIQPPRKAKKSLRKARKAARRNNRRTT